jgi:hypothetical protein
MLLARVAGEYLQNIVVKTDHARVGKEKIEVFQRLRKPE